MGIYRWALGIQFREIESAEAGRLERAGDGDCEWTGHEFSDDEDGKMEAIGPVYGKENLVKYDGAAAGSTPGVTMINTKVNDREWAQISKRGGKESGKVQDGPVRRWEHADGLRAWDGFERRGFRRDAGFRSGEVTGQ